MSDPISHAQNRNSVEAILRQIPGFRGYLEKEYRRDSDELQRAFLAERLQRSKRASDDFARALADAGQIDVLPQVDRVRARLDRLIGRIRGAMQGYSGFFDLVKVDEAMLDRVYQFDIGLTESVEGLVQAVEQLPGKKDKPAEAVEETLRRLDEVERQWDGRETLLKGQN